MVERVLDGRVRTALGKSATSICRNEGRLPAIINDRFGKSLAIDVAQRDFDRLFKDITESTIITIKIDGEEHEVFVKDYQHDIVSDTVRHVDFYEVERGKLLRTKIHIRLVGSPEGVRQGAVLEAGTPDIEVECLPKNLPERVVLDVSNLGLNESLHVSDIKLPETVKVLTDLDVAVATLRFAKQEVEGETEEKTEEPLA